MKVSQKTGPTTLVQLCPGVWDWRAKTSAFPRTPFLSAPAMRLRIVPPASPRPARWHAEAQWQDANRLTGYSPAARCC